VSGAVPLSGWSYGEEPATAASALVSPDKDRGEEVVLAGRFEPATWAAYIRSVGCEYQRAPVRVSRNLCLLCNDAGGLTGIRTTKGKSLHAREAARADIYVYVRPPFPPEPSVLAALIPSSGEPVVLGRDRR
jgi:hypothetical protein